VTDAATERRRALPPFVSGRVALWTAFALVHLWLGLLALHAPGYPIGDVTLVYKTWSEQALTAGYWMGVDAQFVYPLLALAPMLAAAALGPAHFATTWLIVVTLVDAVGFGAVVGWRRSARRASVAWWWLAFLLLLGPIALVRIDSITVPLALVGVLLLATRPRAAALVLTAATWIKVWPAALIGAILIASRHRGTVAVTAAASSAVVVAGALALGSGANVFSFVTQQTGRGLQVEAPVTTLWLWLAAAGVPDTFVYYDTEILTFQVQGGSVGLVAAVMTPVLALAVLTVVALGIRAALRGAHATVLLAPLALALVATLIAVNKVGSPQFIGWLAVPVVLGLAGNAAGVGRSFRVPAALALLLAALTQAVYPYLYTNLLGLDRGMLLVLTARNLLLFVLLGWAVHALVVLGSGGGRGRPGRGDNGLGHSEATDPVEPATPSPASPSQL
jgi:hypothetical protein